MDEFRFGDWVILGWAAWFAYKFFWAAVSILFSPPSPPHYTSPAASPTGDPGEVDGGAERLEEAGRGK